MQKRHISVFNKLIIVSAKKNETTPIKIATVTENVAKLVIDNAKALLIIAPTELVTKLLLEMQLHNLLLQRIENINKAIPIIPNIKVIIINVNIEGIKPLKNTAEIPAAKSKLDKIVIIQSQISFFSLSMNIPPSMNII